MKTLFKGMFLFVGSVFLFTSIIWFINTKWPENGLLNLIYILGCFPFFGISYVLGMMWEDK